jgi:hypothetical protein
MSQSLNVFNLYVFPFFFDNLSFFRLCLNASPLSYSKPLLHCKPYSPYFHAFSQSSFSILRFPYTFFILPLSQYLSSFLPTIPHSLFIVPILCLLRTSFQRLSFFLYFVISFVNSLHSLPLPISPFCFLLIVRFFHLPPYHYPNTVL